MTREEAAAMSVKIRALETSFATPLEVRGSLLPRRASRIRQVVWGHSASTARLR